VAKLLKLDRVKPWLGQWIRENRRGRCHETGNLKTSDKVQEPTFTTPAGNNLGSIHEIMIGKPSGRITYAITSFGEANNPPCSTKEVSGQQLLQRRRGGALMCLHSPPRWPGTTSTAARVRARRR